MFSGKFVEDGSDVPVENVAAILVTNQTDQFLDLATMTFEIGGKKATFIITGLPAGHSVWVMESTGMTVDSSAVFEYLGCGTSFRDGAVSSSENVSVTADGNILTAVNQTDKTLENVFIYYKLLHDDGHYFGGITYMVNFGTLKPGQAVEKLGGHYSKGDCEIVRIGWQENQSDDDS